MSLSLLLTLPLKVTEYSLAICQIFGGYLPWPSPEASPDLSNVGPNVDPAKH